MDVDHVSRDRIHATIIDAIGLNAEVIDHVVASSIEQFNRGESGNIIWHIFVDHSLRDDYTEDQLRQAVKSALDAEDRLAGSWIYRVVMPGRIFNGRISVRTRATLADLEQ